MYNHFFIRIRFVNNRATLPFPSSNGWMKHRHKAMYALGLSGFSNWIGTTFFSAMAANIITVAGYFALFATFLVILFLVLILAILKT